MPRRANRSQFTRRIRELRAECRHREARALEAVAVQHDRVRRQTQRGRTNTNIGLDINDLASAASTNEMIFNAVCPCGCHLQVRLVNGIISVYIRRGPTGFENIPIQPFTNNLTNKTKKIEIEEREIRKLEL